MCQHGLPVPRPRALCLWPTTQGQVWVFIGSPVLALKSCQIQVLFRFIFKNVYLSEIFNLQLPLATLELAPENGVLTF